MTRSLLDNLPGAGFRDPIALNRATEAVQNSASMRKFWLQRGAGGGSAAEADPRRNLEDEFGWPNAPGPQMYRNLYDFDSLAARVVDFVVKECWQNPPDVYEDEGENTLTEWERWFSEDLPGMIRGGTSRYKTTHEGHPYWWYLQLVDALSRQGAYGILYYGIDDGLDPSEPAAGFVEDNSYGTTIERGEDGRVTNLHKDFTLNKDDRFRPYRLTTNAVKDGEPGKGGRRNLIFLRAFPESQAIVTRFESNPTSPRYCKPIQYLVTVVDPYAAYSGFGLPAGTMNIHWSRVQHVADVHHHAVSSEDLAAPALQSVLYDVLDGRKVSGSSTEGYWQGVIRKLFLMTHPQLGGDVDVDVDRLADMLEQMRNGMQREGYLEGMEPRDVGPTPTDPTPFYDLKTTRIATRIGSPKRVLEGSERGQLASSQDDDNNSDRIAERQNTYLSPRVVAPGIDKLADLGVSPEVDQFYVKWPPVGSKNALEAAQILQARTTAMAAYVSGGVNVLIPEREYLVKELGYTEDEADAILKAADKAQVDREQEAQDVADEHGFEPTPPDGFKKPDPEPPAQPPIKIKEGERLVQPDNVQPTMNIYEGVDDDD